MVSRMAGGSSVGAAAPARDDVDAGSRVPFAALDRESAALRPRLVAAIGAVLDSGRFILGPEGRAFEREVGAFLGGVHAVGCASGTDALVLALRALEIGVDDEVIVPAFTFAATAEAVVLVGATPVFADIDLETFTIDPSSVAELLGPRTRAVIPVHLFGQCASMGALRALTDAHGLRIVEDAAQAIGAKWRGVPAGGLGHVAAFSFFPTKNLGASGDGGMVTTTDARLAERLRELRVHGRRADTHASIGLNSRLDELHAAVLRVKLPLLAAWNERRRSIAARYRGAVRAGGAIAPIERDGAHHVYNQFTLRTSRRAQLAARLAARGVETAIYYPTTLPAQPAYARWARGRLARAERAAVEVISLPIHPWLTDDEVERVADVLADAA
jgi:UDP-N-acetyl-3-dehydro-alpha-D-glucosamine 3-aminotranferase